ncbi:MAG: DUF2442 domain-containing protein [Xanthobacteraceae bacterium]|nr:DUF2442 domain-containing protein [Xanthobacteraceae bacterium]
MDQFERDIELANQRAKQRATRQPRALAAHYDRKRGRMVIELSTGYSVAFAPERAQGLAGARPADLADVEITPSGYGLHFHKLDADLWLPALLEGVFGSRVWIAAQLGARGGKAKSDAKVAAARANGKLGGRPVTKAAPSASRKTKRGPKSAGLKTRNARRLGTQPAAKPTVRSGRIKTTGKSRL